MNRMMMAFQSVVLATVLTAASLAMGMTLSNGFTYDETGPIVPGKWNSQYQKALDYASENDCPLVCFWAATSCGYCKKLEASIAESKTFAAWAEERGYVLLFGYGTSGDNGKTKSYCSDASGKFPYVSVSWNGREIGKAAGTVHQKGKVGTDFRLTFSGRSGFMPVSGATLADQFMQSCDKYLGNYFPWGTREHPRMLDCEYGQCLRESFGMPPGTNWFGVSAVYGTKYAVRLFEEGRLATNTESQLIFDADSAWEYSDQSSGEMIEATVDDDGLLLFAVTLPPGSGYTHFNLQYVEMDQEATICFPEVTIEYQEPGQTSWHAADLAGYNIVSNGAAVRGVSTMGKIWASQNGQSFTQLPKTNLWVASKQTVRMQAVTLGVRGEIVSASFALGVCEPPTVSQETVSGDYGPQRVTILSSTEGSFVRYTLDGSEVTEYSTLYEGPFIVPESVVVKAKAFKADWVESATRTTTIDDHRIRIGDNEVYCCGFAIENNEWVALVEIFDGDGNVLDPTNYVVVCTNGVDADGMSNLFVRIEGEYRYKGTWNNEMLFPSDEYAVVDGKVWFYDADGFGAAIVSGPVVNGVLTVPDEVNGLPVYAIADYAFNDQERIREIHLPDSVFRIGEEAFHWSFWDAMWENAPEDSILTMGNVITGVKGTLGSNIVLPAGIRGIRSSAFWYHDEIESVTLPEGLVEIGENAFECCSSLRSVNLPNTLSSVGRWAFYETRFLSDLFNSHSDDSLVISGNVVLGVKGALHERIVVPESVTCIAGGAVCDQYDIAEVVLPSQLVSIGREGFASCYNLRTINIPSSVKYIGRDAFSGTGLSSVLLSDRDDEEWVKNLLWMSGLGEDENSYFVGTADAFDVQLSRFYEDDEPTFDWTESDGVCTSDSFNAEEYSYETLLNVTCAGRGTLRFRWAVRAEDVPDEIKGSVDGLDLVRVEDWRTEDYRIMRNCGFVGMGDADVRWNEMSTEVEFYELGAHDVHISLRNDISLRDEEVLLQGDVQFEIRDISWTPADDQFGSVVTFDPNGGTLRGDATLSFGTHYGELPEPVRIGASFIGWTTLSSEEIVNPWDVPLVCERDSTPLASNIVLTAVWERQDPYNYGGEWEVTENGMRCRVEEGCHYYDGCEWYSESQQVICSYEVPGRGWISYKWRVLDANDESRVLYSSSGFYFDGETKRRYLYTDANDDAWFEFCGLTFDWTTARVGINSGDSSEFRWQFDNYREVPVIIEITDIAWEWQPEDSQVLVTLDPCGGDLVGARELVRRETYGELPTPEREGCSFVGWTEEQWTYPDGCQYVDSNTWTPLTSNVTLYAVWEISPEAAVDPTCVLRDEETGNWLELCNFEFHVRNSWSSTWDYDEDGNIDIESFHNVREEYLEWYGEVENYCEQDLLRAYIHGCGTLHFQGLECYNLDVDVRVYVDGKQQEIPERDALEYGVSFSVEIRRKDGYKVAEHGLLSDDFDYDLHEVRIAVFTKNQGACCGGATGVWGALGPLTWTPAPAELTVHFDGRGGVVPDGEKRTFTVGEQYGALPLPTRNKCEFQGWFVGPEDDIPVVSTEFVRLSVTNLYARWTTDLKTAIGGGGLRFATKGSCRWIGTSDDSHDEDDVSAGTGEIAWGETSVMTSVVQGPGLLSFWWKMGEDVSSPIFADENCASLSLWLDGRLVATCKDISKWLHMTMPVLGAGNHIVEWKYTPGDCNICLFDYNDIYSFLTPFAAWQWRVVIIKGIGLDVGCRPGAWVDEVGWTPAANVTDVMQWMNGVREGHGWLTKTLPMIEAGYDAMISAEPTNYKWPIMRAITKLAQLGENENLLAILGRFGYMPDYQVLGNFFGEFEYVDAPLANSVVDSVANEAILAIESALADLESVPEDWTGSVLLNPVESPVDVATYVDRADVTFCRSILKGALAAIALAEGYDLSIDYMNGEMEYILAVAGLRPTFEDLVMDHPEFAKRIRNAERMAEGRELLREALQLYQVFDGQMLERNTAEMHFFEYMPKYEDRQKLAREKVAKILEGLDSSAVLTSDDLVCIHYIREHNITNVEQTIDLDPFFAGEVTRRYLPTQIDGNEPVFDSFPNMSFGGVFPGLTKETVAGWLSDGGIGVAYTPDSEYEPPVLYRTFSAAIPDLGDTATKDEISDALSGSVDPAVLKNVTDSATYSSYEKWASKLGTTGVPLKAIKSSEHAWLSSALESPELLTKGISDEDLKVESFTPSSESGSFEMTVSVKDVVVGSEATKENLKKVIGLEGAATLDSAAFSSDNVDIDFDEPVDGKVKFTAKPKDATSEAFFMKVKALP